MRVIAGLMALTLAACAPAAENAPARKPVLGLVTSLPLVFSPTFSLEGGSPLVSALEEDYEVRALAATDAEALGGVDVLFLAHALPQTAENLVALDEWVRVGGHVLLLADPQLDWDVGLPLGHPQAPAYYFGDTGLLGHWGLTLAGPVDGDARAGVAVSSAGALKATDAACEVTDEGFIATCTVGEGEAIVIADADFLADGSDASIALVERELAALKR